MLYKVEQTKLFTLFLSSVFVALLYLPQSSEAKTYRYIDPKGRLLLTNSPRDTSKGFIRLIKTPSGWVPQVQYSLNFDNKEAFSDYIRQASQRHRVPYHLLHAVIRAESAYNPDAISHAGAQGLMQLMPQTAERFGVKDPFNPAENINGGSRYLSYLIKMFKGNYKLALAAYNAGEHKVIKYGMRIPPYKETQNYVRKVLFFYRQARS
jgi:soluble lytic murein transglycosylase-like protein